MHLISKRMLCVGGNGEVGTPLPIPNREVKHLCADGTYAARRRESRTPPTQSIFLFELIFLRKVPRDSMGGTREGSFSLFLLGYFE